MNRRTFQKTFWGFLFPCLALILFASAGASADDAKARSIMDKVDARDDGDNQTSDMEMVLIDKNGSQRLRIMKSFSKDFERDTQRLMFFLEPPEVEDTAFLTYDYDNPEKDDDQWMYLPALKKTKRIASSDKSSAFMGSDFSYADMTRREVENYNYKLLKEMDVYGKKCWVIESIPKSKMIVDRYGYTKTALFVRQDNYFVVRAINWTKESGQLKYMDVKKLEQIDNIWVGTEIHMTTQKNKQTQHGTIMRFKKVKFNQNLSDDFFSVRRMEKGF